MTDLEITRLCAEAMGIDLRKDMPNQPIDRFTGTPYRPLHDDAQVMALIKKLDVTPYRVGPYDWQASVWSREKNALVWSTKNVPDLNYVVCECVAKMQQKRKEKGQ